MAPRDDVARGPAMDAADMAQQITDLPSRAGGHGFVQARPVRRLCQSGAFLIQRGNVLGDTHDGSVPRTTDPLPGGKGRRTLVLREQLPPPRRARPRRDV